MANHLQKRKTGFTIIELLVALSISSILIAAAYRTFTAQHKVYHVQNEVMEMQQGVRVAMDILARDIRMAGFWSTVSLSNPILINPVEEGIRSGTDSIAVQYQYNGVERTITYFVDDDAAEPHLIRKVTEGGGDLSASPLSNNIRDLQLTYGRDVNSDGIVDQWEENPIGWEHEIIAARISVQVRSGKPDPDYSHPATGDHYRTRQLQSMVRIRNFVLN
ncbi:MAG: PilW family protein [Syntrophobacterales bacterium]|nr:MAG: PilW family protein [Syntrophobacterales bacterium]